MLNQPLIGAISLAQIEANLMDIIEEVELPTIMKVKALEGGEVIFLDPTIPGGIFRRGAMGYLLGEEGGTQLQGKGKAVQHPRQEGRLEALVPIEPPTPRMVVDVREGKEDAEEGRTKRKRET